MRLSCERPKDEGQVEVEGGLPLLTGLFVSSVVGNQLFNMLEFGRSMTTTLVQIIVMKKTFGLWVVSSIPQ